MVTNCIHNIINYANKKRHENRLMGHNVNYREYIKTPIPICVF